MAQLVIRGNAVRGKEVIETLKMLGGKVSAKFSGGVSSNGYYINSRGNIDYNSWSHFNSASKFTIEEFLKRYPYKVGDKVLVKPYVGARQICEMRWDNNANYMKYGIGVGEWFNVSQLQPYKEQETMEEGVYAYNEINCYHQDFTNKVRIRLGDDYEIKVEEGKTYIVRKKPQYPKTYEECCKVLLLKPERTTYSVSGLEYKRNLIVNLQRLLICRDAYWKIAGEQMGLGESWEPDWGESNEDKYCIYTSANHITIEVFGFDNRILAFPTEEICDAFFENFKDLIEACRELL